MKGLLLVSLLAASMPVYAAVYHWKDDAGLTHFTDNPMKVPEAYRNQQMNIELVTGGTSGRSEKEIWDNQCASCHYMGYGNTDGKHGLSTAFMDENDKQVLDFSIIVLSVEHALMESHAKLVVPKLNKVEIDALSRMLRLEQEDIVANDSNRW